MEIEIPHTIALTCKTQTQTLSWIQQKGGIVVLWIGTVIFSLLFRLGIHRHYFIRTKWF